MAWTSPKTWAAGAILTAAELNQQVRDNLKALGDPWTAYTPSWTAVTTNPVLGNGTIVGAYIQTGQLVSFRAQITMGSTTTYGSGAYLISLPVAPKVTGSLQWNFDGIISDASPGGLYPLMGVLQGAGSAIDLRVDPATAGNNLRGCSATVPITFATGDIIAIQGIYEAA